MDFEPLVEGYYLEGLIVIPDAAGDAIWFTDVTEGGVKRLSPGGAIDNFIVDRNMVGGLLLNHDGKLLVSGGDGIAWFDPANGKTGLLLDGIPGAPGFGVNEMRPDGSGGIVFGSLDLASILRGGTPRPAGLYRLGTDNVVTALAEGLVFTNGLAITQDGGQLVHNESFVGTFAYPRLPDGTLGERVRWLDKVDADGLALDAEGHIWVTGFSSGELIRLTPQGAIAERIALPGKACTNVRFGGADMRDIYVTVVSLEAANAIKDGRPLTKKTSTLYKARSPVAGAPITPTGFTL